MKILVFGDIYGRVGRKAFVQEFGKIKQQYQADFCIVNIENITSGRWPVTEHAELIESLGVDIMTTGDHAYDNAPNINEYFQKDHSLLIRPANFYTDTPGTGYKIIEKNGKRVLVMQLLGEVFMSHKVVNPFQAIDTLLSEIPKESYDISILDFHRETTAEMYGMAYHVDGRIGGIYGTHTHIQTNDAHVLEKGTGMITDVGMNGPFHSVIGADFNSVKKRFLSGIQRGKIEQKLGKEFIINAAVFDIDDENRCRSVENISYTWSL